MSSTPHPLDSLGPFSDEKARLTWVVATVMETSGKVAVDETDLDQDLTHVLTALVTHGIHLAHGVSVLLNLGVHAAPGPVERSLYEVWCEIREVLDQGPFGAQKVLANSLMELAEGDTTSEEDRRWALRYADALAVAEKDVPEAVQEVREQRAKRKFHWSGKSRTELMRLGSPGGQMYKALSWEGHASLVALRDAVAQVVSGKSQTERTYPAAVADYMDPEAVAFRCSAYLSDMWGRFCHFAGIPDIVWPESFDPPIKAEESPKPNG